MTATVDDDVVETETDEPASVITDELVRSLALKLNPFVKVGREPPVTNLRPSGFLADVVESLGWSEAERTFPEVGFSLAGFGRRWRNSSRERRPGRCAAVKPLSTDRPFGV